MSETHPLVIAVVPVHNRLTSTSRFLAAARGIDYPNLRIIVVDDGSVDGTGDWVRTHHPEVQLITADGDQWWAGSTNLGVSRALAQGADYLLTINDDSGFDSDFLTHLVACAEAHPGTVVGSRLMWADRPQLVWSLGTRCRWAGNRLWEQVGRDRPWPDLAAGVTDPMEVDTLCGNGTLIPARVFAAVGLYDAQRLPQYHADADLVLRARRAGWRVLVETRSVIHNDPRSSTTIRRFWWSLTDRRSPLFLPALLTILGRWCPVERRGLLLLGQYAPILLPFLRRRSATPTLKPGVKVPPVIHIPQMADYADIGERWHSRRPILGAGRPANEPLVTIITVTRNAAKTLPDCLASVADQSWPWIEHLVIDGGSNDGTVEFLRDQREFTVGWISEPDLGISDAFNKGIALAHGSIIGILNADDLYKPHAISRSVMLLRDNPLAAFSYGACDYSLDGEVVLQQHADPDYAESITRRLSVSHPTMFVRSSAYARHGLYRTDLKLAMDHDFLLRLDRAGAFGAMADGTITCMALGGISGRRMWAAQWESAQITIDYGEAPWRARARFAFTMAKPSLRMLAAGLGLRCIRRWLRKKRIFPNDVQNA